MKSATKIFEIAIFLGVVGVGLTVAFTCLKHTEINIQHMQANVQDVRQIRQVVYNGLNYDYMRRPGAYLDALRLAFSIGTVSADSRAKIRVFDTEIEPYDMYSINIESTAQIAPMVYKKLTTWWDGFSNSEQYNCDYGVDCLGAKMCPDAQFNSFDLDAVTQGKRTFAPKHITADIVGYEMENPTKLDDAKFKLRVVESGKDVVTQEAILEYRIYIFLGSLVKSGALSEPKIEYRWYECVMGSAGQPWVVLE